MMADQQPFNENDGLLNFDEAKIAIEKVFGATIGTLSLNNAILEKRLIASQQTVSQLIESEVALVGRIADLEDETARIRHQLSSLPQPLPPEVAALAADGRAAIQDNGDEEKEKAAPVEAA